MRVSVNQTLVSGTKIKVPVQPENYEMAVPVNDSPFHTGTTKT
jgi:hypothetical protein